MPIEVPDARSWMMPLLLPSGVIFGFIFSFQIPMHAGISSSSREEDIMAAAAPLRGAGRLAKEGVLGTANAPVHVVTADTGHFKDQLWRTFRTIALAFLLISGVGALIEDRGISKGLPPPINGVSKLVFWGSVGIKSST